jgi:hypothetical protein
LKSQHRKRKAEDERDRTQNNWYVDVTYFLPFFFTSCGQSLMILMVLLWCNNRLQFQQKGRVGGGTRVAAVGSALKKPKRSMFASPDSVDGRVGVVGSGRPMTAEGKRDKHFYAAGESDGKAEPRIPLPADII